MPIFDQMLKEQNEQGVNWTPSKVGGWLSGRELDNLAFDAVSIGPQNWNTHQRQDRAGQLCNSDIMPAPDPSYTSTTAALQTALQTCLPPLRLAGARPTNVNQLASEAALAQLPPRALADHCAPWQGDQPPGVCLLLGLPEQHPGVLPRHHRRIHWGHAVLPQVRVGLSTAQSWGWSFRRGMSQPGHPNPKPCACAAGQIGCAHLADGSILYAFCFGGAG